MKASPGPAPRHTQCWNNAQVRNNITTFPLKYDSPDAATSEIGTFCSYDIKPRIEKIAKPATKLVPLFRKHSERQSLQHTEYTYFNVNTGLSWNDQIYMTSFTCNSYCYICCSCPVQSVIPNKWHRRKRSECQHPSTPTMRHIYIKLAAHTWVHSTSWSFLSHISMLMIDLCLRKILQEDIS